jgi:hypothetical protein
MGITKQGQNAQAFAPLLDGKQWPPRRPGDVDVMP